MVLTGSSSTFTKHSVCTTDYLASSKELSGTAAILTNFLFSHLQLHFRNTCSVCYQYVFTGASKWDSKWHRYWFVSTKKHSHLSSHSLQTPDDKVFVFSNGTKQFPTLYIQSICMISKILFSLVCNRNEIMPPTTQ